jgi:hypothetical protein
MAGVFSALVPGGSRVLLEYIVDDLLHIHSKYHECMSKRQSARITVYEPCLVVVAMMTEPSKLVGEKMVEVGLSLSLSSSEVEES